MYQGFMKLGVSLMIIFFGLIAVTGWLNIEFLIFILPVIWFYSFFDSMNRNSISKEQFDKLEDNFIWGGDLEIDFLKGRNVRIIAAVILILTGITLLLNNIMSILEYFAGYSVYYVVNDIMHYSYQIIAAVVIIAIGIRLITGKKKEIEAKAENVSEVKFETKGGYTGQPEFAENADDIMAVKESTVVKGEE